MMQRIGEVSFHHYFSRQGNIPSHHIFTHPSTLSHYPPTCGSLCPQVLGSLLALFTVSGLDVPPPPCPVCLKAEQPQAHSGIWNIEGEIPAPAPQWRTKEQRLS